MAKDSYVKLTAGLTVASDASAEQKLYHRAFAGALTKITGGIVVAGSVDLVTGLSPLTVNLGDIATAHLIMLETDAAVTVNLTDGSPEAHDVRPRIGSENGFMLMTTNFTAMTLTWVADARVSYVVVGVS